MSIFAKTHKGHEEMEHRSGGLHPRLRRLLILIDGVRRSAELSSMLSDSRFEDTLAQLRDEGYIELRSPQAHPVVDLAPADTTSTRPAASGDLELARNFMTNTLKAYNGPYNKLGLIQRIHGCGNLDELRSLFSDWLSSINETHAGRKRAQELTERLQAVM